MRRAFTQWSNDERRLFDLVTLNMIRIGAFYMFYIVWQIEVVFIDIQVVHFYSFYRLFVIRSGAFEPNQFKLIVLKWKCIVCLFCRLSFDQRFAELLDFAADDLTGRSLYALCHAGDVRLLRKSHTDRKPIQQDNLLGINCNQMASASYCSQYL